MVKEREGLSYAETAKRFAIGKDTLTRWHRCLEPKKGKDRPAIKIDIQALKKDIERHPDHYHYERAQKFGVSASGIRYAIARLGMTHKKRHSVTRKQMQRNRQLSSKH